MDYVILTFCYLLSIIRRNYRSTCDCENQMYYPGPVQNLLLYRFLKLITTVKYLYTFNMYSKSCII